MYGLLCTGKGCPVAIEVFEGNTADPRTVGQQVEKLRERLGLKRVVIVGDRGVLTEARIGEHMASQEGLQWITALRGPAIRELVEQGAIQQSVFGERDLAEIHWADYPNERPVVCRNPLLAEQRARTRQELLEATEKALQKIAQAVRREKRPLGGKEKIALRVGKVLDRYKVGKHFKERLINWR